MTISELIEILGKFDQSLPVCYRCHSEQVLLEAGEIGVKDLCLPRPDGWVQNKRPDMESIKYLVLPGN